MNDLTEEITNVWLDWCKLLPCKNVKSGLRIYDSMNAYVLQCIQQRIKKLHLTQYHKITIKQNIEWLRVLELSFDANAKFLKEVVNKTVHITTNIC